MGKPRTVVGEDVLAAVRAMLDKSNTSDAKTLKEWPVATAGGPRTGSARPPRSPSTR
jgi:hypothetical protein